MAENDVIENFGLAFEKEGLPRIAGRVIGFLMLNEGPFTLDDLAEKLRVSKASASTNARLLEELGILAHSARPGDRRDYYQLAENHGERMIARARQRFQRLQQLMSEAADALPAARAGSRTRLREMQAFYEFLLADLDERMERWRAHKATMGSQKSSPAKR